ncbi:MAG: SDR family oxidoreductase, partial [Chloroflexota bacterium]
TFIACDVTSEDSVASLIAGVEEQYGRLDMAYNNAGIVAKFEHVHKKPVEDFDRVIAVNVRGVFLCMKYEIPLMLKNGGGAIVNTSSTAGLVGVPGIVDYAASKHAVVGMTKTAAIEYAKQGIRINCIHPAGVNTPMIAGMNVSEDIAPLLNADTPMGRLGEPQEIADAVVWLSSDEASFITGTSLPIDAGSTAV